MIDIRQLKAEIENNNLTKHFIIFKCGKINKFIPHQYALEYCGKNDVGVVHVDSPEEFPRRTLFDSFVTSNLIIYEVDKLSEELPIEQEEVATNNIWVVCKNIDAKIKKLYEDYIVEVPKIDDWQILDLISTSCPDLLEKEQHELFDVYKEDLFRLNNELDKIKLCGNKSYQRIKSQLYVDISNYDVFDITNAIIRRDKKRVSDVYNEIENIDVDPFGLLTLLINNFRKVIDIQLSRNPSAESVGVSDKQFWAIRKYSCGFYSKEELVEIFTFLNGIDYKVKSGELPSSLMIDYIICKVLSI